MAIITGSQGNFTYTSGDSIANIIIFQFSADIVRPEFVTRRFGWSLTSRTAGQILDARVQAQAWSTDSGKQPVPTGTVGDLTLTEKSGQTYVFKAVVTSFSIAPSAQTDEPQVTQLLFEAAATSSSDTIV